MASSKDTFESKTFASNTFACGTWRGLGAAIAATITGSWSLVLNVHGNADQITVHGNQDRVSVHGNQERV